MLIGLVGKPSVGKSTFFQAATSVSVPRAAYPFTTIEPNHGVGYVEVECVDKDFGVQCNPRSGFCVNHRRFVPVELLDVAGLVPGAHEGKGLGNKFLDDLRQADVLIHVVDASGGSSETGDILAPGSRDPCLDVRFLEDELDYWVKGILDANYTKLARLMPGLKDEDRLLEQFSGLNLKMDAIRHGLKAVNEKSIRDWSDDDRLAFCSTLRRIGKPIIIAANKCDLPHAKENFEKMKKEFPQYLIVPCFAEAEIALKQAGKAGIIDYIPGDAAFTVKKELNEPQKKALDAVKKVMDEFNGTGVQKCLNSAVFDFLKYIAVFPGGANKLQDSKGNYIPDCFLMPPGSTAKEFAGAIHSDFAEKFIKAVHAKTKMVLGADYLLKHRDVMEIMFKH